MAIGWLLAVSLIGGAVLAAWVANHAGDRW